MVIPIQGSNLALSSLYRFIYLFHMPLFTFVSGCLSKGIYRNGVFRTDKVLSMFIFATVFKVLLSCADSAVDFEYLKVKLLYFSTAPWYLFSLATWYCSIPFVKGIKPEFAIVLSIVIALISGYYSPLGEVLSIGRTIRFYPYFLAGYYCSTDTIIRLKRNRFIGTAVLFIAIALTLFFAESNFAPIDEYFYLVQGNSGYTNASAVWVLRDAVIMCIAVVYSISIIFVTPNRELGLLSYIGSKTMPIYVIHRFLRTFIASFGFYNLSIFQYNIPSVIAIIGTSTLVTAVCLIPILGKAINSILNMEIKCLLSE